jgi:peroxiredoxin
MKTRSFVTVALTLALAASSAALAAKETRGVGLGQPVADFKLPDADGKEHALSKLKGKNGTVIIFISAQCPMVRAYNERIARLAEDYKAKGVHVVGTPT